MKFIGILIPETNIVVEDEIIKMVSEDSNLLNKISLHFSRIEVKKDYSKDEKKFLQEVYKNVPKAINLLEFLPINIFGFFCTSAILLQHDNTQPLFREINNIPIIDPLEALLFACKKVKPKNVLLFSPYNQWFSKLLEKKLKNAGISVAINIFANVNRNIDKYSLTQAKKLIILQLSKEIDLIIISCTNFRSLEIISFFEKKFNVPVISSNQALFWMLCKKLGIRINGLRKYGVLFEL